MLNLRTIRMAQARLAWRQSTINTGASRPNGVYYLGEESEVVSSGFETVGGWSPGGNKGNPPGPP